MNIYFKSIVFKLVMGENLKYHNITTDLPAFPRLILTILLFFTLLFIEHWPHGHSVEHHVYHHNDDAILIDMEENSCNVWQTVERKL